jgi:predicted MFS family arabinose efflux permease
MLYALSFVRDVKLLIALYAVMGVLHSAHESPKNILLAEMFSHEEWGRGFATQRLFADMGWMLGLVLGFFVSQCHFSPSFIIMLCSGLHVAAFICALVLINEPLLAIERKLLAVERSLDHACEWLRAFDTVFNGGRVYVGFGGGLRTLCLGMVLFFLAGEMFYTPLPAFLSRGMGLSQSTIFVLYALDTASSIIGYVLIIGGVTRHAERLAMRIATLCRSGLAVTLALFVIASSLSVATMTIILMLMGFTYAVFFVCSLILSMELVSEGRSGLFSAIVNLSSACGAFLGPFVAERAGFVNMFLMCGLTFLAAYAVLRRLSC